MDEAAKGNLSINTGFAAAEGRATSGCGVDTPVPMAIAVQCPALDPISIYEKVYLTSDFEPQPNVAKARFSMDRRCWDKIDFYRQVSALMRSGA